MVYNRRCWYSTCRVRWSEEAGGMGFILVVDDEAAVRQVLRRWLSDAGRECREAADAAEALDVMAASPADVAFCDVQMPGKDGIWLTGEIRARYPATAVVLATGVTTVPPKVSMQAGVMAYLVKPIKRESFVSALEAAVSWHEQTVREGPRAEDRGARLNDWLDELKEM